MHSLRSSYHESGWPRWALFAAVPFVLAVGLIAGMAIATYTGTRQAPAAPQQPHASAPPEAPSTQPPVAAAPRTDSSWQIPTRPEPPQVVPQGALPPLTSHPRPTRGPQTTPIEPSRTYFTGTPDDANEAALALSTEFEAYIKGGVSFRAEYRQMRQSGQGVTLVGMIRASAYPQWVKAMQENPAQLTAWLQSAAARVQPAAIRERFFLSWAVVDILEQRPTAFADQEITPLDNGTFLVMRPLASTVDYAKTDISLRSLASLNDAAAGRVAAVDAPWTAYGPMLHFDSTDQYRPVPLGVKPIRQ